MKKVIKPRLNRETSALNDQQARVIRMLNAHLSMLKVNSDDWCYYNAKLTTIYAQNCAKG